MFPYRFKGVPGGVWEGSLHVPGVVCLPMLCFVVFPCAVCGSPWCVGACCSSPLCFVLCVSWGVVLWVPCPLRSLRCCATLAWCACVVLIVWSALFLAPGAVERCFALCCLLWCSVVRCWVWLPAAVFWWRASVLVSLSGPLACFPVVGVVCCGVLPPCFLLCGAVMLCSAVFCGALCACLFLSPLKTATKPAKIFPPLLYPNKIQLYSTDTPASSNTMYGLAIYVLPVVHDVLGLVLVPVVGLGCCCVTLIESFSL